MDWILDERFAAFALKCRDFFRNAVGVRARIRNRQRRALESSCLWQIQRELFSSCVFLDVADAGDCVSSWEFTVESEERAEPMKSKNRQIKMWRSNFSFSSFNFSQPAPKRGAVRGHDPSRDQTTFTLPLEARGRPPHSSPGT